jgi:transposase
MRFYIQKHQHTCGIDLHGRSLYVCVLDREGEKLLHRRIGCDPDRFLALLAPFREDLVIGVECMFSWYWVADLCADEGIPFVLGHALEMKAVHGAKTGNDRIDSERIARLLLGGLFPQAFVYPRDMRSTRDLLRRRSFFVRKRAELLSHIQNTNTQVNLPPIGERIDRPVNRAELAERFDDPNISTSIAADVELIDVYDDVIRTAEKQLRRSLRVHDQHSFLLLRTIPGVGEILAATVLYEIHHVDRFAKVGEFLSYSRLVKCFKTSVGKIKGVGGSKRGNVHLKWAFSEAAALFLRANPVGQKLHDRLVRKHGKAKAMGVLAAKLARAAFFMLKRRQAFDLALFVRS